MVNMLRCIQKCSEKNNQRGITWKVRKGELLFLWITSHHDLAQIPTILHEYIPNGFSVMACTGMFGKNNQRGIIGELRKGEQSFFYITCHPDLIHIPIHLHQ